MELNREQIIKALECYTNFKCNECPIENRDCENFGCIKQAIALIKEITEENERLKLEYEGFMGGAKQIANHLKTENERLTSLLDAKCDRCISLERADTVREMQERLKQAICDNTYPDFNKDGKPVNVWNAKTGYDLIDEVAEEMLTTPE